MASLGGGNHFIEVCVDYESADPHVWLMLRMMFKLGQCAEKNWRKLRGFDYLEKVIEGVQFSDGIEVIPEIRIAA